MKRPYLLLLLAFLTNLSVVVAQEALPLKVEGAWMRAVPEVSDSSAIYFTIVNTGDKPLKLTGGDAEIASMIMPMVTTRKTVSGKEVFGMEGVNAFEIPAGGKLVLDPGGNHLMVMGLKKHLKPGEKFKLTLKFEPGGKELQIELPVAMEPVKQ